MAFVPDCCDILKYVSVLVFRMLFFKLSEPLIHYITKTNTSFAQQKHTLENGEKPIW